MMRRLLTLVPMVAAATLVLAGCAVVVDPPGQRNEACEAVGSEVASQALQRQVEAEPSPVKGPFLDSCDYYEAAQPRVLAGVNVARDTTGTNVEGFEDARASSADPANGVRFRNEEGLGVPAYSIITTQAEAHALVGTTEVATTVYPDQYGEPPERAREAARRLLQQAVARVKEA